MQVRTLGQLKATQSRMLELYKQDRSAANAAPSDEPVAAAFESAVGRIDDIVTADETLGPHMKVALQQFAGSPPSPADASGATQVYYPVPGRSVGDFAIDEYVKLLVASGVRLAAKL